MPRILAFLLVSTMASQLLSQVFPNAVELQHMAARFAPTPLNVDLDQLSAGDKTALTKLIQAGRVLDQLFLEQLWSGNVALYKKLLEDDSEIGKARLHLFWIYKGPWSDLDAHKAFIPGVPERKPLGANFYPEDMTRAEFEKWAAALPPDEATEAKGFFSVIRRDPKTRELEIVPYSQAYKPYLQRVSQLLTEAAEATDNESLKRFLKLRAKAFMDDHYYASDLAWMDL